MLAPTRIIKNEARAALGKNRTSYTAVATILIFTVLFISLGTELISLTAGDIAAAILLIIASVLLAFPLILGVIRFYWRTFFELGGGISEVFYYFSSSLAYRRAARFAAKLAVRVIALAVICLIPAELVRALCSPKLYSLFGISIPNFATNLWLVQECLYSIGIIVFLFLQLRYYLVPFLIVINDELSDDAVFGVSRMISKRNAYDFIGLVFSFAGWIVLSLTAIPLLYTVPYFVMAYIVHCRLAVEQYNAVSDSNSGGRVFKF